MNLPTLIIVIVLGLALVADIVFVVRKRRRCPHAGSCPFAQGCSGKGTDSENCKNGQAR